MFSPVRTLLLDNYDSFTYNLHQLLWEVVGSEPTVVRNDQASWEELAREGFEAIVVSPGPGSPTNRRDFGVCAEAIRHAQVPLLGICLGMQGIGSVNGGRVVAAPRPRHGQVDRVSHDDDPLFAGIPESFDAVRYHSLGLARPLPACLREIARADDGVVMAVAHRERPQWGVQFHPESVASEFGRRLIENFRDLVAGTGRREDPLPAPRPPARPRAAAGVRLLSRRLPHEVDPELAFLELFATAETAFWLDSARSGPRARFSFMGDASGPLAAVLRYSEERGVVEVERGGNREEVVEPIFSYLERELERLRPPPAPLPFEFGCGFVGYLGYELKAENTPGSGHRSRHPDACLVLADRVLAFDRERGQVHLLCLVQPGAEAEGSGWIERTARQLERLATAPRPDPPAEPEGATSFTPRRSRDRYLGEIEACQRFLRAGESYELCLTNGFRAASSEDPLLVYRRLRRHNPAPHAAYLRFGDLAVLSASPERFLSVDAAGAVEARPIKGTGGRDRSDPAADARLASRLGSDAKNRTENLMIVDLLRNDLGSVCEVGSVEVPELMAVETYETVHQMVSTVRGRLRRGVGAVGCVRACFPPGSMTGVPKRRTVELLDELEAEPRGIYSGVIGYFGLGGGCDLSVAIRTIVVAGGEATIGTGGAIVLDSDPRAEWEEVLLKAETQMAAVTSTPAAFQESIEESRVAIPTHGGD